MRCFATIPPMFRHETLGIEIGYRNDQRRKERKPFLLPQTQENTLKFIRCFQQLI